MFGRQFYCDRSAARGLGRGRSRYLYYFVIIPAHSTCSMWPNYPCGNGVQVEAENKKVTVMCSRSAPTLNQWSLHVVVWPSTRKKCTKTSIARSRPLFFFIKSYCVVRFSLPASKLPLGHPQEDSAQEWRAKRAASGLGRGGSVSRPNPLSADLNESLLVGYHRSSFLNSLLLRPVTYKHITHRLTWVKDVEKIKPPYHASLTCSNESFLIKGLFCSQATTFRTEGVLNIQAVVFFSQHDVGQKFH